MRYLSDGSVKYPKRGNPPDCPSGFMPDPLDPFHFYPVIKECPHRQVDLEELPCRCGFRNVMRCSIIGTVVGPPACHKCQTIPGWINQHAKIQERNDGDSATNERADFIHG